MANDQAMGGDGRIDVTVDSRPAAAGLSAIESRMAAFASFVSRTSNSMASSFSRFNAAVGGGSGGGGAGAVGALGSLGGAMGRFNPVLGSFTKLIGSAVTALTGFLAIRSIIGMMEAFMARTIEVNRVYTGFIASMGIVRGSTEAATKEYEFLLDISNRLGVQVETSISQYHRLAAALKNVDTTGELTRHLFSGLSQAAVVLHARGRDVTLIFEAVQQMASKGKLSLEELQRQLGNTLPGAMGIAARAMMQSQSFIDAGVKNAADAERYLRQSIEKGTINVYEFLARLADQLKKEYGAGVEYASNQFTANFNRMKNSVFEFYRMVGSSGAMEGLTNLIREVTALFNDGADQGAFGLGQALGDIFNDMAEWVKSLDSSDIDEFFTSIKISVVSTSIILDQFLSIFSRFDSSETKTPLFSFVEFVAKTMAALVDVFSIAVAGVMTVVNAFKAAFYDLRELAYAMPDTMLDASDRAAQALPDWAPGVNTLRENVAKQQAERRAREAQRQQGLADFNREFDYFINGPDKNAFDRVSEQFDLARNAMGERRAGGPGMKAGSSADAAAKYVNPLGNADLQKLLEDIQNNSNAPNDPKTGRSGRSKVDSVQQNFLREQTRLIKDIALAETEYQNVLSNRNLSEGQNVAQMRSLIATDERYIKLSQDKKDRLMELAKQLDDMNLKVENARKSQEAYNQALQAEYDVAARTKELQATGYESKYRRTTDVMNSFQEGGENQFMDEANRQRMLSAAMREDAAQRNLDMARYAEEIRRSNDEMTFQAELLGLSKLEQARLTEFRKIDLQIQQLMVGATLEQQAEYLKLAEILKGEVSDALQQVQNKQDDLWLGARRGFQEYVDSVSDYSGQMADITKNAFSGMEDAFVQFVETGKMSFSDLVRSIAKDLVRLIVRYLLVWFLQKMTGLGGGGGGGGFSFSGGGFSGGGTDFSGMSQAFGGGGLPGYSKGGAFDKGVQFFAKGGVFTAPFAFPMAGGKTGIGSEAGPEAIMPLARDSSGSLGVRAIGGGEATESVLNLTVEVYQGKGDGVKTEQSQNEKGDVLKIFIGEVASDIQRGGQVGKALTQTYGLTRKPRSYT